MGRAHAAKGGRKQTKTAKRRPVQRVAKKRESEEVQVMKNGQTWSIDLIIGVIIFMLIIAVFYAFLTAKSEGGLESLKEDALVVNSKVNSDDSLAAINIVKEGSIDEAKYQDLCKQDYETIKSMLGVENGFCIYLEEGENSDRRIVPCTNADGQEQMGIGNGKDIILYTAPGGTEIACGDIIS